MVSAVILQHGLTGMTRIAIESLRLSEYPVGEIIVVDNASPAGWLGDVFGTVVVPLTTNTGYTRGTNAGWRQAKGEYALLCNNDISLARQCVGRLVAAMATDPRLGWVSASYQAGQWKEATTPSTSSRWPANVSARPLVRDPAADEMNVT